MTAESPERQESTGTHGLWRPLSPSLPRGVARNASRPHWGLQNLGPGIPSSHGHATSITHPSPQTHKTHQPFGSLGDLEFDPVKFDPAFVIFCARFPSVQPMAPLCKGTMYENHFHGGLSASWNQSFVLAKHGGGYRQEARHQKTASAFAAQSNHGSASMVILSGSCSEKCQQCGKLV